MQAHPDGTSLIKAQHEHTGHSELTDIRDRAIQRNGNDIYQPVYASLTLFHLCSSMTDSGPMTRSTQDWFQLNLRLELEMERSTPLHGAGLTICC